MNKILGLISLLVVFMLAPAAAWSQPPPLTYGSGAGAGTDISGGLYDEGLTYRDANGNLYNPCPATQVYGQNSGWLLPARQTGGDGLAWTSDTNSLNVAGRTETTTASADAGRGLARAFATADVSLPCTTGVFMSASGLPIAQFYDTYTVVSLPAGAAVNLQWS